MTTHKNRTSDDYRLGGSGRLVYLHFGQETDQEEQDRQALFARVAESLGVTLARKHLPIRKRQNTG